MIRNNSVIIAIILTSFILIFIVYVLNTSNSKEPSAITSDSTSESIEVKPKIAKIIPTEPSHQQSTKAVSSDNFVAKNNIVQCETVTSDSSLHTDEKFSDFSLHLQQANSPDKQLAYILFASQSDKEHQLTLLLAYNKKFAGNKRVLMDLIGLCSSAQNNEACTDTLLNQASELDADNGALWLQVANFHAAKGNIPATFEAIEKAVSATRFNDYYYDKLALFMQTSKGALDVNFSQRAMTGLGYHAATSVWVSHISNFCLKEKGFSDQQKQLCLALGKTMATQSNSQIISSIGLNIQSQVYQKAHNEELHLQAEKQKSTIMQKSANHELYFQAQALMLVDERLFDYWLTSVMEQGEAIADEMLIKEAIILSKNPYYQPCAK